MSEREKFEKWADSFDTRRHPEYPDVYMSVMTQCAWAAWQAALSTRKPCGWGIIGRNGFANWGSAPFTEKENATRTSEHWTEFEKTHSWAEQHGPYRVLELFYEDQS